MSHPHMQQILLIGIAKMAQLWQSDRYLQHLAKAEGRSRLNRGRVQKGKPSGFYIINQFLDSMNSPIYGPVLLVCIFNKYGNVITHDYFYQLFSPYGDIVKILIFEKAKVWKTFIEFSQEGSARTALLHMNNHVVFEDGGKMNIFSSKLKHIQFQNSNLGGVNYEELKADQGISDSPHEEVRTRRSTMQPAITYSPSLETYGFAEDSAKFHSAGKENMSSGDKTDTRSNKQSNSSFNLFDIDEQFRELARDSEEYRELEREEQSCIRPKSKTMVTNPNLQQFVFQNSPSKVLFIRSIDPKFTNSSLYHIFRNFGVVVRVIYMPEKCSGLVEFSNIESAIIAKDQINYAKPEMKVFYSHYETLTLRKETTGEELVEYSNKGRAPTSINPPSEVLYLTYAIPRQEDEIRYLCLDIGCPIQKMEWKQNSKDGRWMCLVSFSCVNDSLLALGLLQGSVLSNGKEAKFSFTRSKIGKGSPKKNYVCSQQILAL